MGPALARDPDSIAETVRGLWDVHDMDLGDVLEVGRHLLPKRAKQWLVMSGLVVLAFVPAVREPVVRWWVDRECQQVMERLEPLLAPISPTLIR